MDASRGRTLKPAGYHLLAAAPLQTLPPRSPPACPSSTLLPTMSMLIVFPNWLMFVKKELKWNE